MGSYVAHDKGLHSTERAFAVLTQQPRVRISALPFLLTVDSKKRLNPSSAYARDFANAVQQRPELSNTKK